MLLLLANKVLAWIVCLNLSEVTAHIEPAVMHCCHSWFVCRNALKFPSVIESAADAPSPKTHWASGSKGLSGVEHLDAG